LLFWFCAGVSGKKNRPLLTLLVIAGVTLVNLLAPYGRVLAEIGPLSVTAGSLVAGLRKGITLEGLFMLSGAVVRGRRKNPGIPAPGIRTGGGFAAFRGFLEESLAVFAVIRETGGPVRPGRFIEDIDRLLLEQDGLEAPIRAGGPDWETPSGGPAEGRPLLILGLLISAAFTVLPAALPGILP
jgi:heptaprenyl diphosphate synthase